MRGRHGNGPAARRPPSAGAARSFGRAGGAPCGLRAALRMDAPRRAVLNRGMRRGGRRGPCGAGCLTHCSARRFFSHFARLPCEITNMGRVSCLARRRSATRYPSQGRARGGRVRRGGRRRNRQGRAGADGGGTRNPTSVFPYGDGSARPRPEPGEDPSSGRREPGARPAAGRRAAARTGPPATPHATPRRGARASAEPPRRAVLRFAALQQNHGPPPGPPRPSEQDVTSPRWTA